MFKVFNTTPMPITVEFNNKRVLFPPGETLGMWNQRDYFTHEDVEYMTSVDHWGRMGLMHWDDDKKTGHMKIAFEGERRFLRWVQGNIDAWLQQNTERHNSRHTPVELWKFNNGKLLEMVKLAEELCKKEEHKSIGISVDSVNSKYMTLIGGVVIQNLGKGTPEKSDELNEVIKLVKVLSEKVDDQAASIKSLEEENELLMSEVDKKREVMVEQNGVNDTV